MAATENERSVLSLLRESAATFGDNVAIEAPGQGSVSYRSLLARVTTLAGWLRDRGVKNGDDASRVAIVLPNGPGLSIALLGACILGIAVPLGTRYRPREYRDYFERARVKYLLVDGHAAGPAEQTAIEMGITVLRAGREVIDLHDDAQEETEAGATGADPRGGDIAVVLLTAGTTGRGKIVPLTHTNLLASTRTVCQSLALGRGDRCLSMWEQYHVGGVVDLLLAPLAAGNTIISAGDFDTGRFFELLESHSPTWFQGVPATLRELCRHAHMHDVDPQDSSLRFIRSVAAALPEPLMVEIESRFGIPVIQTFGMTEAAPLISSNQLPPVQRKPGSVGIAMGTTIGIHDEQGRPVERGDIGDIAIKGINVFSGYEDDMEANASAFSDGWFYTGDQGRLDEDGFLFLTGRSKEIINRGGEKVSPTEIDEVLLDHPAVAEAAVFAIPHTTLGEEIAAAIVLEPGNTVTDSDLRTFASQRLSPFKLPKTFLFCDSLPHNAVGKVQRNQLARDFRPGPSTGDPRHPRTALEILLAEIWKRELDLEHIGIDDDFSALGGDSLSSVRILVAVEAMFDIRITDNTAREFETVERMATALSAMGVRVDGSEHHTLIGTYSAKSLAEQGIHTANKVLLGEANAVTRQIGECRSLAEYRLLRQTRESIDTPNELREWLEGGSRQGTPLRLSSISGLRTSSGLAVRHWLYRRRFVREFTNAPAPRAWSRQKIGEYDYLFHDPSKSPAEKTLIIGFTGDSLRLMLPTYQFLFSLNPHERDLLLLTDPERNRYRFGNKSPEEMIETVSAQLDEYVRRRAYRRIVTTGVSSGGLPAICVTALNGWPRALAFGAEKPSLREGVLEFIKRIESRANLDEPPAITLSWSANNRTDTGAAKEIARLMPSVKLVADERFREHQIVYQLYRAGDLGDFLERHLL